MENENIEDKKENPSAASQLIPMAKKILELELEKAQKYDSNIKNIKFERKWLDEMLSKYYPEATEGAKTGSLNRLFGQSENIAKIGWGEYIYSANTKINVQNVIAVLENTIENLEQIFKDVDLIGSFDKQDLRVAWATVESIDVINDLIQRIKNKDHEDKMLL